MALHVFARFWDNFNLEPWPFFRSRFSPEMWMERHLHAFFIFRRDFSEIQSTLRMRNAPQNLNRSKVLEHIPILNRMYEAANSCWTRARFSQQLKWHSKSNCERVVYEHFNLIFVFVFRSLVMEAETLCKVWGFEQNKKLCYFCSPPPRLLSSPPKHEQFKYRNGFVSNFDTFRDEKIKRQTDFFVNKLTIIVIYRWIIRC